MCLRQYLLYPYTLTFPAEWTGFEESFGVLRLPPVFLVLPPTAHLVVVFATATLFILLAFSWIIMHYYMWDSSLFLYPLVCPHFPPSIPSFEFIFLVISRSCPFFPRHPPWFGSQFFYCLAGFLNNFFISFLRLKIVFMHVGRNWNFCFDKKQKIMHVAQRAERGRHF